MASEVELERLIVRLLGDASHYQTMLNQAQTTTQAAMANIRRIGLELRLAVSDDLQRLGRGAVSSFAQFDQAMTESTSIMGELTDSQRQRLRQLALDMSGRVIQAPHELARSYFYLASAGKDAEQSMALLPSVSAFATAGMFSMERATSLLVDSQSALGLSSNNAATDARNLARVSDVLVRGNVLANTSVEQLAEALTNDAAAAMRAFGIEVEEGTAVLAAMADQGNKGMAAGSEFARMLRLMSNAARENRDDFERMGIQVFDSQGNFRALADVVQDMETALGDLSPELKGAALEQLGFNALAQRAIIPLIGTSDRIRRYHDELRRATGYTAGVAQQQMQSFTNQVRLLWNQLQVVGIEIGQVLAPVLLAIAAKVRSALTWWQNLDMTVKRVAIAAATFLAVLGPLLFSLSYLPTVLGSIGAAMGLFTGPLLHLLHLTPVFDAAWVAAASTLRYAGVAVLTLLNPLRLLRVAIGGIGSVIALSFGPSGTLFFTILKIGALIALFINRSGGIEGAFNNTLVALQRLWQFLEPVRNALVRLFMDAQSAVAAALLSIGHEAEELWHLIDHTLHLTEYDWMYTWETIRQAVVDVINVISLAVYGVIQVFRNMGPIMMQVWQPFSDLLRPVGDLIASVGMQFIGWVGRIVMQNRGLILGLSLVVAGITSIALTVRSAMIAIGLLHGLLVAVKAIHLAGIAAWLAETVSMAAYKVVLFLINAQMVLFNLLLGGQITGTGGASIAMGLYNAVMAITNAVLAITNAGLAAFNILIAPASIIAFVAAASVLAPIFVAAAAAVYGVREALTGVLDAFASIDTSIGPVRHIGDMLGEWAGILREVVVVARTNVPLAWRLLQAGAMLAINQVRDLWPPLWQFIQEGFSALWNLVTARFQSGFYAMLAQAARGAIRIWALVAGPLANQIAGPLEEAVAQFQQGAVLDGQIAANAAQQRLRQAVNNFRVVDSAETQQARRELELVRGSIRRAASGNGEDDEWHDLTVPPPEVLANAQQAGRHIGNELSSGMRSGIQNSESVLRSSNEAIRRIEEQRERLSQTRNTQQQQMPQNIRQRAQRAQQNQQMAEDAVRVANAWGRNRNRIFEARRQIEEAANRRQLADNVAQFVQNPGQALVDALHTALAGLQAWAQANAQPAPAGQPQPQVNAGGQPNNGNNQQGQQVALLRAAVNYLREMARRNGIEINIAGL